MTDPNNLTPPTPASPGTSPTPQPDPQDAIDQALGGMSPSSAEPTPSTIPEQPPAAPSAPEEPEKDLAELKAAGAAEGVVVPAELTEVAPAPTPTSQDPSLEMQSESPAPTPKSEPVPTETPSVEAKGDDVPLALVGETPAPVETAPTAPPVSMEPTAAVVPPAMLGSDEPKPVEKKKKKTSKVVLAIAGFFVMFGVVGAVSYSMFGQTGLVAVIEKTTKWIRVGDQVIKNPNYEKTPVEDRYNPADDAPDAKVKPKDAKSAEECTGCSGGGWLVWRNGECRVTGICDSGVPGKDTVNPNIESADTATNCQKAKGLWCKVTDANGANHEFCGSNSGDACYQQAIAKGITMQIGNLMNFSCKQDRVGNWVVSDPSVYEPYSGGSYDYDNNPATNDVLSNANSICANMKSPTINFGNATHICKMGVVGDGGVEYTGGACTALNGKPFKGSSTGCFCGTVQVDVGSGHRSYSSTCGCDKEEKTTTTVTSPSPSPSPTVASLMCNSLTKAPTTTPKIGDKLTFTCAGSTVPAGATTLSYKFRYSINNGTYVNLVNKTATTAELTIAACGNYKVQCQACGILPNTRPTVGGGSETCDPIWSGAETL